MFVQTPQDLFWLVLAFCLVWFTFFVTWLMYYFIAMFRRSLKIVKRVEETVELIHDIVVKIKDKAGDAAAYLTILIKSSEQLKGLLDKYRQKKSGKKNKNK